MATVVGAAAGGCAFGSAADADATHTVPNAVFSCRRDGGGNPVVTSLFGDDFVVISTLIP